MAHDLKVSEATGRVLDWMVAKALGLNPNTDPEIRRQYVGYIGFAEYNGFGYAIKNYSTDWSQGGPIIEREMRDHGFDVWRTESMTECAASYTRGVLSEYVFGPTPLIAAMRCFVASKLGDIVKVPKEMNHGA